MKIWNWSCPWVSSMPVPTVGKIKEHRAGWFGALLWWQVLSFPSKFLRFGDNLKNLSFLKKPTLQSVKLSFGIQPQKPSPQLCSNSLSHHSFDFLLVSPRLKAWSSAWWNCSEDGFFCQLHVLRFRFFFFCHHESGQKYPERTATFFWKWKSLFRPQFFLLPT